MVHKHMCWDCGKVIAKGDFDCESDTDHDFQLCDRCAETTDPEGRDQALFDLGFGEEVKEARRREQRRI